MAVMLSALPMPPTENLMYGYTVVKGRPVPYKAKGYKEFERAMVQWRLENLAAANSARKALIAPFRTEQLPIRVDRYFSFPRHELIHPSGLPRRMDAFNRIKCFDDMLAAEVLGIDDSWFISGWCEKVIAPPGDPASVTVCLTHSPWRPEEKILKPGLYHNGPWAVWFARATIEQTQIDTTML